MRPSAKKALSIMALLAVMAVFVLAGALCWVNAHRQRLAVQMMNDAARLKPGSDMSDVLAFANRYSATLGATSPLKSCTDSDCLVMAGVPSDTSVERHPKLNNAYDDILRRAWKYEVSIWVKDGKLTGQQQWFSYNTPTRNLAVIAETSSGSRRLCRHPSYILHDAFSVEMAPHHFSIWVNPKAKEADAISQLDLQCVSALRGCNSLSEMAPEAWRRYERDRPAIEAESEAAIREASAACVSAFKTH